MDRENVVLECLDWRIRQRRQPGTHFMANGEDSKESRQAKSIALSRCPRSRTIALFMTFFTHHHHNPKCKNEQHFVWVMVVRCGE